MISILLAEDHEILRKIITDLLRLESDFHIVGDVSCGKQVITLAKELKPDVVVTDLFMDDINGLEVIREVKRYTPNTNVVVLSVISSVPYVFEALNTGAHGYVLKDSCYNTLAGAIRMVFGGNYYLSPPLSFDQLKDYNALIQIKPLPLSTPDNLLFGSTRA